MQTLDEKVRDVLGTQTLEILRLQVRIETLEQQLADAQKPAPAVASTSGTSDNESGVSP